MCLLVVYELRHLVPEFTFTENNDATFIIRVVPFITHVLIILYLRQDLGSKTINVQSYSDGIFRTLKNGTLRF